MRKSRHEKCFKELTGFLFNNCQKTAVFKTREVLEKKGLRTFSYWKYAQIGIDLFCPDIVGRKANLLIVRGFL